MSTGMKIEISKTKHPKVKPDFSQLGFGKYFSDHMFIAQFSKTQGWHSARIQSYGPLSIEPGASVLHYSQTLFEGMKAFKQTNGDIVLFRPSFNAKRLQQGADRLCMEAPPTELMTQALHELVKADHDWVPTAFGSSLYLRPTLIGTESFLGVRPSDDYLFFIIASPVGSYYSEGSNPVKIWIESEYIRAAQGGLGFTKAGANYAASLKAALVAKKKGYSQVLWLDTNHEKIEEVGTMNVFFVFENEIVTPALNGTILAGGVRECAIQMLKHLGYKVSERAITIDEVKKSHEAGKLKEVFGTGTAAVISPVGELANEQIKMVINNNQAGEIAQQLYSEITAIQYGQKKDIFNWLEKVM